MLLAEKVYDLTKKLPPEELYGLSSQLRRSAISIPSNIAEGQKRGTKDFARFLIISYGSSAELETQILLAQKIYPDIKIEDCLSLTIEVQKMLSVLISKVKKLA